MIFKQKTGHLAGIIALSAVMYLPQASASTLAVPSPTSGDSFTIYNIAAGSFTDSYAFTVNNDAIFSFSGIAIDKVGTGLFIGLTKGDSLQDVTLLDTTTNTTQTAFLSSTPDSTVVDVNNTYIETTYLASLGGILLNKNDNYELVYTGNSETSNSTISSTIFLTPAPAAVAAVPLPSATWLFLTGLMGFLGLSKSRNTNRVG